jgi:hypothetical protein
VLSSCPEDFDAGLGVALDQPEQLAALLLRAVREFSG